MRNNSHKHTFTEVDPTPKHGGKLNRAEFRALIRPWRARKISCRVLRETQVVVPEKPRGRKLHNLLREMGLYGQEGERNVA